jgi:hypothetical protein
MQYQWRKFFSQMIWHVPDLDMLAMRDGDVTSARRKDGMSDLSLEFEAMQDDPARKVNNHGIALDIND